MPRLQLKDELWSRLKMIFFVCGIYQTRNLRMTIEGILYKLRTGCPWRDLPSAFGQWNSIFRCFNRWSLHGKLKEIFYALTKDPDHEWTFIDGSIVKAHNTVLVRFVEMKLQLENPWLEIAQKFTWLLMLWDYQYNL